MSTSTVEVETRGAVALVTLNRPDSSNTLNLQVAMDLLAAAMTCGRNPSVRAVVLTGAGKNFCFGGDLRGMLAKGQAADAYLRELTTYLHEAISHFVRMDPPVIAAVNGTAAGAGVGLVAMADLAVCGASAKFNMAYTGVGLTPDAGTSFLLPRAVGVEARDGADAAESLAACGRGAGLGTREPGRARTTRSSTAALELGERLAAGATQAFGRTKRLVSHSLGAFESQMVLERETIAAAAGSEEGLEGISAFLEKRKPGYA